MMEENNHIFFAGGHALVYLTEPIHKNVPQNLFGVIYLVRTYLMTDFSSTFPLYAPVHVLDDPPSIPSIAYGVIIVHFKFYLRQCYEFSQLLKYDGNIVIKHVFQSHVVEKNFQNLRVRLSLSNENTTFSSS